MKTYTLNIAVKPFGSSFYLVAYDTEFLDHLEETEIVGTFTIDLDEKILKQKALHQALDKIDENIEKHYTSISQLNKQKQELLALDHIPSGE